MQSKLKNNAIFLVVGKSGSGKTTMCDAIGDKLGAKQLISYTERKPRGENDKSHIFVQNMERWQEENPHERMVASTYFCGNYYWATNGQVEENNLYVIDVNGVKTMQYLYTGNKRIIIVYIDSSPIERFKRMVSRGDGVWNAVKRIVHDHYAFKEAQKMADFTIINNGDFNVAVDVLAEYMVREDGI